MKKRKRRRAANKKKKKKDCNQRSQAKRHEKKIKIKKKVFSCFGIRMLSMCVIDIMNVLRTGMSMSISRIHIWLCNNSNMRK